MVSARRLRKSSLKHDYNINLDFLDLNRDKIEKIKEKKYYNDENECNINIKNKFYIKFIFCSIILFFCLITKLFFFDEFKNNKYLFRIYNHYKFDFSKELVLENFENYLLKNEYIINNLVPLKIKNFVIDKYVTSVKKYLINFSFLNLINKEIDIYKDIDIYKEIEIYKNVDIYNKNLGIGGFEPINKNENINKSDVLVNVNLNQENFVNPTKGIVTSRFGNREVIFKGVNPYHTGIDIANKEGTDIVSVSNGKVIEVKYNNKFYGNYIVIKYNEYKFKYAHLKQILVNEKDIVEKGKVIGKMGSTGLSTGPHLHFEVMINDIKINPEEKFKF